MPLGIVSPLIHPRESIMTYTEPMDWVVIPPTDEEGGVFYGARSLPDSRLFIASGCCAALMVKADRMGSEAGCSKCGKRFYISPYDRFDGEVDPFILSWGQFSWRKVERVMQEWLDFYFNLSKNGDVDVEIKFDGLTAEEQYDR